MKPTQEIFMTEQYHAIIWLDHREAKIFHFNVDAAAREVVHSHATGRHLQHKANTPGSGHKGVDKEYFERVIAALTHSGAILVTGPANAKTELKNYIGEHHPALLARISGVEALDHPSDGELLKLARKYFKADDRMHAQRH
jgi:stalled ribosome rescue protein Dom34